MTADDICKVIGVTEMNDTLSLKDMKYEKLLTNEAEYFLASAYNTYILCFVKGDGSFNRGVGNKRHSTYSIFIF